MRARPPFLSSFGPWVLALSLAGALSGCSNDLPAGHCTLSYQCDTGSICVEGLCQVVQIGSDAGAPVDAGQVDAGVDAGLADAGQADAGSADAGATDAGARLTFAPGSYRRCKDDLECAVFGGNCVVELTLSRPTDGGVDRVKVADLDPSFATGEGVCTLPCTSDPRICDSMTVTSVSGQSVPFTCQVVYAAPSPYPATRPAFPFDAQLDPVALSRGVPYASLCRPPFQYSVSHSAQFCQACTQDLECGATGACFMEKAFTSPPSGSCVEACSASNPCAFGFTCSALPGSTSGATYCVPAAGTCGRCRDADGDLRGVGRCGALTEPNTGVDCDDSNPVAYYDAADMGHAFPGVCGASDVNCNGKSDDAEQLGSEQHCGACGDVCVGRVGEIANARKACLPRGAGFACVAQCDQGFADCDGQVSTGCEQALGSNSIWAEDKDGDGRGSQTNFLYVCTGTAPAGWVQNQLDCNDADPSIYGGSAALSLLAAPELCDGKDNNCNGTVDDPGLVTGEGAGCSTGVPGVCAPGLQHCVTVAATADAGASGSFACVGNLDATKQASVAETCNGLDDNCNGQTDENLDYFEAKGQTNPGGHGAPAACPVPTGKGICAQGVQTCTVTTSTQADGGALISGAWTCVANTPLPTDDIDDLGVDSNCDGSDGDLSKAVFVRPVAGAGNLDGNDSNDGTAQHPVATVQRALAVACASGAPCRDIFLEAKTFTSTSAIAVPTFAAGTRPPVRLYGGFTATAVCGPVSCALQWTRGTSATTLARDTGAKGSGAYPFGTAYSALEAASGTGPLSFLIDQVKLETHAPSPGSFLQNGESAPTQIGVACPARGCGLLSFRNVSITVEPGMNGGDGTAGAAGPAGASNGGDGCGTDTNCSGESVSDWMQYPVDNWGSLYSMLASDKLVGKAVAGCPDGRMNNGGSSAAVRFAPAGGGNRQYLFDGQWGSGVSPGSPGRCWDSRDTGANPQEAHVFPSRGGNGTAGSGGSWIGTANYRLSGVGQTWQLTTSRSRSNASIGTTGSSGGGGGGCINHPDYFACPCGEERGGGGGAGGCGGFAGGAGGEGGTVVGLVLASVPGTDVTLTTSGDFAISVGNGGNGGKGGNGGAGQPGGYGGQTPGRNGYLQGANGGDGGGGGAGAGGNGGSTIGLYRQCLRPGGTESTCGFQVPPLLLASPGDFVSVGTAGALGAGGTGGAFNGKQPDFNGRTDSSTPAPGGAGGAALTGITRTLYFNN